jgi:O-antigen ligase
MTQSVGGLAAFVSILALAIFCFARNLKRTLLLLPGICASIGVLHVLGNVLSPAHTEEAFGSDMVIRLLLWNTAWDLFRHSPVLGVGWGKFIELYGLNLSSFSAIVRPGVFAIHNICLQLLAETGMVGLVAFFRLVVQSWRQAQSQLRSSHDFLDMALGFGVLVLLC